MNIPTRIRYGWSCLLWCLLLVAIPASAQYTQSPFMPMGGCSAIAFDRNNNLYTVVYSEGSSQTTVLKIPGATGYSAEVLYTGPVHSLGQGNLFPWGLAINSTGDVFYTTAERYIEGEIMKIPFNGTSYGTPVSVRRAEGYLALAFDQQDNLLTMQYDINSGISRLMKYNANDLSGAGRVLVDKIQDQLMSNFPWGLAVDKNNNVYYTTPSNSGNGRSILWQWTESGTRSFASAYFTGLACDGNGNLYTQEIDYTANSRIAYNVTRYTFGSVLSAATVYSKTLFNPNAAWNGFTMGLTVNESGSKIYFNEYMTPGISLLTASPVTITQMSAENAQLTNATSVRYKVNYTPNNSNLPPLSAFSLGTTGNITGATVSSITPTFNSSAFYVDVNTGQGDGTLVLKMTGNGMPNPITNPGFNADVYTIRKTPPKGTLVINDGAAYTNSQTVKLDITNTDATTVSYSNDQNTFGAQQPLGAVPAWQLLPGEGTQTVYAKLADALGNTAIISQTITVDQTPPVISWIAKPVLVSISRDTTFIVSASKTGTTVTATLDGTPVTFLPGGKCQLTGLSIGRHTFEVTATDLAGNKKVEQYQWAIVPTIVSIVAPQDKYYKTTAVLNFIVMFSGPVTVTGGGANTPFIPVKIDGATRNAYYVSSDGVGTLTFRYTVQQGDEAMNGITLGPDIVLNNGTIKSNSGDDVSLTLNNLPVTTGIKIHTAEPVVLLSSTSPLIVNGPFTVNISFNEDVSDLAQGQVQVSGASLSNFEKISAQSWKVLVTPAGDGMIYMSIPGSVVTNVAGVGNKPSLTLSRTADITAPKVLRVGVPANGYYKANSDLVFDVVFDENVALNTTNGIPYIDVTIGSQTKRAVYQSTVSPTTLRFSYKVAAGDEDRDGISVGAMLLNGATIRDLAGNDADITLTNIGNTTGVFVSTELPGVVLTMNGPAKVKDAFTVTAVFSEKMTGLSLAGIYTSPNASLSNLATTDDITYTFLVSPGSDGAYTLYMPAGAAKSARTGYDNLVSNTLNFTVDITPPAVSSVVVPANATYGIGKVLAFNVVFSEPLTVTGTPSFDLVIGSKTVQANYSSSPNDKTLVFTYTVQEGDTDADGIAIGSRINLNSGAIKDEAGNNALPALNNVPATAGVKVNTDRPVVTLSTTAVSPVGGAFTIKAVFSEKVNGLSETGFAVINGNIGTLQTTDNTTFTATVTPVADGMVSISLKSGVATSSIGNSNMVSNALVVVYDGTPPAVTSMQAPADDAYAVNKNLVFTVTFDEPVFVTGTPSLPVTIGSRSTQINFLNATGANKVLVFSYVVQPGDMAPNGIQLGNVIQLNGGSIKDAAGNPAKLTPGSVPATNGVIINTNTPTAQVSASKLLVNGAFNVTVVFDEPVTGLSDTHFNIDHGTAGNLVQVDNVTYTMKVTPTTEGTVSIYLRANTVANNAHTFNLASNVLNINYDGTAPAVTNVTVPANAYYKDGQALNFTVNLTENVLVQGTPAIPVHVGNKTVQAVYTGGTGTSALSFRYIIQPGDRDMDGITLDDALQLNGGSIKDAADNNAVLTLNNVAGSNAVLVNTQHPQVSLATGGVNLVRQPFLLTIRFDEAVTGFTTSGISVTNGTLSQLQTADNTTFTVLVTPSADGALSVQVPADVAQNVVNYGNQASNTVSLQADITPPVVSLVNVPANGYYKSGDLLEVSVVTSEPVYVGGIPSIPLTIGSQTVAANYTAGTGTATLKFRYTVRDGDMALNGIGIGNTVSFNGGTIRDAAGNDLISALSRIPATTGVIVKTNRPLVTLATTSAARINVPFTVQLTLGDEVKSLSAAMLQVSNGTAGTLQTTDNIHYTTLITPAADGNVTIQLPADAAFDKAGNGNLASNSISVLYDVTAPAIGQQTFEVYDNSLAGTLVGQATATDASGTLQDWKLVSDGSGGALSLDANGHITVKDNALLRAFAGQTTTLRVTVSDGLNTSMVATVSVKVLISFVNKPPVMNPVADVQLCATAAPQTIQLTGVSPVEADQHYTIRVSANQPYFDVLTADVATNTIRYQLKTGASGHTTAITVTIQDDGGTDNGGKDSFSQTFYLTVNPLPVITISSDKGNTVSKGDQVTLTAEGAVAYSWAPAAGITGDLQQTNLRVRPMANVIYTVTGTNAAGCSTAASISIVATEDYKLDATNILTPNGDGINDRWVIRNLDSYPDNEVKIFDRSGRMVYQRRNYSNDWDATLNGRPLAEGTYYYVLTVNGNTRVWKGFITIIRNDQ